MAKNHYEHTLSVSAKKHFDKQVSRVVRMDDPESSVQDNILTVMEAFFHLPPKVGNTEKHKPSFPNPVTGTMQATDGVIDVSFGTGGSLFADTYRVLLETKKGKNFSGSKRDIAEVLSQVLSYCLAIREAGSTLPKVIVVADEDEVFYLPASTIMGYLDGDYQWEKTASAMHTDTALVDALMDDKNIAPYVHVIDGKHFNIETFLADVAAELYGDGTIIRVPVTEKNMTKLFMDFNHDVFGGVFEPVDNQTQLRAFFAGLTHDEDSYLHPEENDVLVLGGTKVQLPSPQSARAHEYFFNHVDTNFTDEELTNLVGIFDQGIIHDKMRRFHGDFFTPKIWVDQAHRVIEDALGDDWREKYVVVDPACGTKNLTRDYDFAELYSMTLHQEELDVSEGYNNGEKCVAQQYDFLNDDVLVMHGGGKERPVKGGKKALKEWEEGRFSREQVWALSQAGALKMPQGLVRALYEKKPIVWFANPPYGQATSEIGREHRAGMSSTALKSVMPKNYGHAKQELYTQFIYRVQLLAKLFGYKEDFHFFFFFNKGFLTAPHFHLFSKKLTEQFAFQGGFMMNAGEFSGTSSAWGITFSHWEIGGSDQREFDYPVMESIGGGISEAGVWRAQMVGKGETITDWLHETPLSKVVVDDAPLSVNGLEPPKPGAKISTIMTKGWTGYMRNSGNNIQNSDKYVFLLSHGYWNAHGRQVSRENFLRGTLTFSVRRSVQEDIAAHNRLWIQDKDIFRAPSSALSSDETFLIDCLVYSLFDKQSRQTSLRNYAYNGSTYTIVNEFFPWSSSSIKQLAVSAIKDEGLTQFRDVERDISQHGKSERLVYTTLEKARKDGNLSAEAQALLDASWKLVEESFNERVDHAHQQPRYQVANWDAGWLQIRSMMWGRDRINDNYLDEKPQWDEKLRALGDKIAQRAYADGIIGAPDAGVNAADGTSTEETTAEDAPLEDAPATPEATASEDG